MPGMFHLALLAAAVWASRRAAAGATSARADGKRLKAASSRLARASGVWRVVFMAEEEGIWI